MARRSRKPARPSLGSLLMRAGHWLLVIGLWVGIGVGCLFAYYALELPSLIEKPEVDRKPLIAVEDIDSHVVARYGEFRGANVPVADLPPYVPQAVMAIEDRRFYQHFGIDLIGLTRAMTRNVMERHLVQGGSTITQQLAKNLFLTRERTLKRKIQEAMLAVWLEHKMTKDEILTAYLNRVYLGSGTYGIEAAAQTYFNKSARDLTLHEATIIAGLLKAPSRYSPLSNPKLADERAATVLAAMQDAGYLTTKQKKKLLVAPDKKTAAASKPQSSDSVRYYTDWVVGDIDKIIGAPNEDIAIETTLVPAIQKAAEQAVEKALATEGADKNVSQGAVIVMARDGAVLAMVGGRNYATSQFNRAVQAYRQPGSSFKPVVYLTALEHGYTRDTIVNDARITTGKYRPTNFKNEYYGEIPLYEALAYSLNTVSYQLTKDIGVGYVIGTARRLGIEADLARDLSLALGSSGVPMIQMITAYGTIANDGYQVEPYAIRSISDKNGTLIYSRPPRGLQDGRSMFNPQIVQELQGMMQGVVEFGTGGAAKFGPAIAGKTGTSQDFRDAWFSGFTDQYITSVWVGNDDNSSMKRVTGGSIPARIWREVMMAAHASGKGRDFATHSLPPDSTTAPVAEATMASPAPGDDFGSLIQNLIGGSSTPAPVAQEPPASLALSPPQPQPHVVRARSPMADAKFND